MMIVQKCGELVALLFGPISMPAILYEFSGLGWNTGDGDEKMTSVVELKIGR